MNNADDAMLCLPVSTQGATFGRPSRSVSRARRRKLSPTGSGMSDDGEAKRSIRPGKIAATENGQVSNKKAAVQICGFLFAVGMTWIVYGT
jgi:hypothetical protein